MDAKSQKLFKKHEALYRAAVRRNVCGHCVDFSEDGSCKTHDAEGCAVFRYLPELVQIALQVNTTKIEPYLEAVRGHLCSTCKNSKGTDRCEIREGIDCGLDRYLLLVLEAIDEVNRQVGI